MSAKRRVSIEMGRTMGTDKSRELLDAIAETFEEQSAMEIECVYVEPWDVTELARLERRLNQIIGIVLREGLGYPIAKRAKLVRFDMANMVHVPDGKPDDKNIVVTLDAGKLLRVLA